MIKKKSLVLFFLVTLIIFYIYTLFENASFLSFKYIMLISIMVICTLMKVRLTPSRDNILLFVIMVFIFTLYPLFFLYRNGDPQIFYYSILSFIFILFCFWISSVINYYNILNDTVILCYFCLLFIILYSVISTSYNIFSINSILKSFDPISRERPSFGFNHPNTAGNIAFLFLIVCFKVRELIKSKKNPKIFLITSELFAVVYLVNSGSRGAITSLIFFYISYYLFKTTILKLNSKKIFLSSIFYVLLFLSIFKGIQSLNLLELNDVSSGRINNWSYTIAYLSNTKNLLLGIGYLNPSYFYSDNNMYNFLSSDNWYVYICITLGLFGLFIIVILFIYILVRIINKKQLNMHEDKLYITSLFLSMCYYSSLENLIFNPSMLISLYLWIWIFSYFGNRYNKISITKKGNIIQELKL
ncbi:O-antigen polymerase [Bacillus gobiensis]|uniref:O-antigen ligase family protein n=1 Tax=Bacillus gobiensis TaxID=1441095 RepID=UPI003D242058